MLVLVLSLQRGFFQDDKLIPIYTLVDCFSVLYARETNFFWTIFQDIKYTLELGTGGVQGQVKGQRLMGIKVVNDSIGLATCQSKIYEK